MFSQFRDVVCLSLHLCMQIKYELHDKLVKITKKSTVIQARLPATVPWNGRRILGTVRCVVRMPPTTIRDCCLNCISRCTVHEKQRHLVNDLNNDHNTPPPPTRLDCRVESRRRCVLAYTVSCFIFMAKAKDIRYDHQAFIFTEYA